MFGNVFTGESFSNVALTNAINQQDYVPMEFDQLLPWEVDTSLTRTVAIDSETGYVYVLDPVAPNSPAPEARLSTRTTFPINIPRYAERESVLNESLIGVRDTGTVALKTIEGERDKKLKLMLRRFDMTRNFARSCAVKRVLTDSQGNVLVNFNTLLGENAINLDLDLGTAGLDVNKELTGAKELSEDAQGEYAAGTTEYQLICGREAYKNLAAHKSSQDAYRELTNLVFLRSDQRKDGFLLSSNVVVRSVGRAQQVARNKDGQVTGRTPFIGDNDAYLCPVTPGFWRTIYGPSAIESFFGQVLPYYVARKLLDFEQGVEMMAESFAVHFPARPGAIVKLNVIPA